MNPGKLCTQVSVLELRCRILLHLFCLSFPPSLSLSHSLFLPPPLLSLPTQHFLTRRIFFFFFFSKNSFHFHPFFFFFLKIFEKWTFRLRRDYQFLESCYKPLIGAQVFYQLSFSRLDFLQKFECYFLEILKFSLFHPFAFLHPGRSFTLVLRERVTNE